MLYVNPLKEIDFRPKLLHILILKTYLMCKETPTTSFGGAPRGSCDSTSNNTGILETFLK